MSSSFTDPQWGNACYLAVKNTYPEDNEIRAKVEELFSNPDMATDIRYIRNTICDLRTFINNIPLTADTRITMLNKLGYLERLLLKGER